MQASSAAHAHVVILQQVRNDHAGCLSHWSQSSICGATLVECVPYAHLCHMGACPRCARQS